MSKVIIVDNPRKDFFNFDDVKQYGQLINIRDHLRSAFNTDAFEKSLLDTLDSIDFNPHVDYIVIIGRQIQVTLTTLFVFKKYKKLNLLMYSHTDEEYLVRNIE